MTQPTLQYEDDIHVCPFCCSILNEEDKQGAMLYQYDPAQDAVNVRDMTFRCPECRIRIHKRVKAR